MSVTANMAELYAAINGSLKAYRAGEDNSDPTGFESGLEYALQLIEAADPVAKITADIKEKHERVRDLLSFVEGESHNMSTVEGAIDTAQEIDAEVGALLAVQAYATGFTGEYIARLEAQRDSLNQSIAFNERLIRGDEDMLARAIEDELLTEEEA